MLAVLSDSHLFDWSIISTEARLFLASGIVNTWVVKQIYNTILVDGYDSGFVG